MKKHLTRRVHRAPAASAPTRVIAVLCLVQFVDVLGVTEVLTATPQMVRSLMAGGGAAAAVLTSYAVCFGGLLMVGARLGDRFGHRRVLLGGVALFAVGSLWAATAASVPALVAGRCLQGAAAAASVPASLRLLIAATPSPGDRRTAMSAWSAAGAAAGASGFVVGGALTQLAGWRAMFWIDLPLALIIAAGILHIVASRRSGTGAGLDLPGGLLFSAGVAGLVLGGSLLQPPAHLGLGVVGVAGGVALLLATAWVERRAAQPLIPVPALRQRALRTGAAVAFLNTATTSSALAIATLELQRSQHLSAGAVGLRLMPLSLSAIAGAGLAAPALHALRPRMVIGFGLVLIGAGDAALIALVSSGWLVAAPVAVAGAGLGLSSVASNAMGTDVAESLQATAAGALNTAAQLGTALGVAALLLLSAATTHARIAPHGPALGWAAAALLALTGAAVIAVRPETISGRRGRTPAGRPGAPTPRA
jgi:MFS family permease